MQDIWLIVSDPAVQRTLSWLGGGITAIAAGLWAAIKYSSKSATIINATATRTARAKQGIAAVGDVNFRGRMVFKNGVPVWLIILGFLGLAILIFSLFVKMTYLLAAQAKELFNNNVAQTNDPANSLTLLFEVNGVARAYSFKSDDQPHIAGSWHVNEDGTLCLDWTVPTGNIPRGCFHLNQIPGGVRLVQNNEIAFVLKWFGGQQTSDAENSFTPEQLQGLWRAGGYQCLPGVRYVEMIRVVSNSDGHLIATKETGDECVNAGEVTFRGTIHGDILTVQWRVGGPTGNRGWEQGSIRIISTDFMIAEPTAGETVFFQRMQ